MSQVPIQLEPLKTDNKDLQAFDAKVLLIVGKNHEIQKKLELDELNQKISQVDQLLLNKQTAEKLAAVNIEKKHMEQEVYKPEEPEAKVQPPLIVKINKIDEISKTVHNVAPAVRKAPSVIGKESRTIKVSGGTGFDLISKHQFHAVFSEAGKVVDITKTEDGREVTIAFDSIASALSAVKHAPDSIDGVKILADLA